MWNPFRYFFGKGKKEQEQEQEEIRPFIEQERTGCPFYGFAAFQGVMLDQVGNQCALITSSYSPCKMIMESKFPEWRHCSLNNSEEKETLEKVLDSFRIFPKEFKDPNKKEWEGIPLRTWVEYIEARNGERS